jgi:hypothetical protein
MPRFSEAAGAWLSADFDVRLRDELSHLDPDELPLRGALTPGARVEPGSLVFRPLRAHDEGETITIKVGVLFSETLIGCVCGDDPTSTQPGYCELEVQIDKRSARGEVRLLAE